MNIHDLSPLNLNTHSRVHPSNIKYPEAQIYIKRDDELSFGLSGTKLRKYLYLIPAILKQGYTKVAILGGKNSNNVLSLFQLFTEMQIPFCAFLRGDNSLEESVSNHHFLKLFGKQEIHYLSRDQYGNSLELVNEYAQHSKEKVYVLAEGGFDKWAIPGAMTLAEDIHLNSSDLNINFDHIFLDSGTGCLAGGALIGFIKKSHKGKFHIIQLADGVNYFLEAFEKIKLFSTELGLIDKNQQTLSFNKDFFVYEPITAKSFGSVNQTILNAVPFYARQEGFFTDPIYTAKFFLSAHDIIQKKKLKGHILLVHSGGGLGLTGFMKKISVLD